MKVLFISHSKKYGGAEIVLRNIIRYSNKWDSEVYLPEGEFALLLESEGIKIFRSKYISSLERRHNILWPLMLTFKLIGTALELIKIIYNSRPDIIHSNHMTSTFYCILPAIITRKKLIWHMHDAKEFRGIDALAIIIMSRFVSRIIAVSKAVEKALLDCGVKKTLISVCYNGVDEKLLKKDIASDPRYFKKQEDKWNVVQIGVLCPIKGQEVFIDAIKHLESNLETKDCAKYFIVGGEFSAKDDFITRLEEKIEKYELSEKIKLCGHLESMKTVYSNTDILVFPSLISEALPTVILEANAMNVLVIASNVGGVSEIITDGETGFLFEKGDSIKLSEILSKIFIKDIIINEITEKAKIMTKDKFSLKKQTESIAEIYFKEILSPPQN